MTPPKDATAGEADIVAKLERWAGALDQQLAKYEVDTLYDAIAEIERLRADNERLTDNLMKIAEQEDYK